MSTFPHPPGTVLQHPKRRDWIVCSPDTGRTWTGAPVRHDFARFTDRTTAGRVPPHLLLTAREWLDGYRLPEGYDPALHDLIWKNEWGWDWSLPGWFDQHGLNSWTLVSRAHSGRPEPACDAQPSPAPGPPQSSPQAPQNAPERPLEAQSWKPGDILEVPAAPARPTDSPHDLGRMHRPDPDPARPTPDPLHCYPGGAPYKIPDDLKSHWIFNPPPKPKENPMFRLMKFAPKASAWLFIGWLAFGGGGDTVKNHVVEWWTAPTPLHLGAWTRVTTCDSCQHVLPADAAPGGLCPSCGGESFSVEKAQALTEEFWNAWPETGAAWWDTRVVGWAFPDGTTRTTPGHWRLPSRTVEVQP